MYLLFVRYVGLIENSDLTIELISYPCYFLDFDHHSGLNDCVSYLILSHIISSHIVSHREQFITLTVMLFSEITHFIKII